jgi:hypothetical protein
MTNEEIQEFYKKIQDAMDMELKYFAFYDDFGPVTREEWLNIIKYGEPDPIITPEHKAREAYYYGDPYINMLLAVDERLGVKRTGIAPTITVYDEPHEWTE